MVVELLKTAFYDIRITPSQLILTHHRVIVPTSNMLFLHQKSTGNLLSFLYASYYVICHSYRIFATTDNPPVSVRVSKHGVKHKKLVIVLSYENEVGCIVSGTTQLTETPSHSPYSTTKVSVKFFSSVFPLVPSFRGVERKKEKCVVNKKRESPCGKDCIGLSP